jgi:isoleucyl-tRNA synthetase
VTPLMVEEVWEHVPVQIKAADEHPLRRVWASFGRSADGQEQVRLDQALALLQDVNRAVKVAQEEARSSGAIRGGLETDVHIHVTSTVGESEVDTSTYNELFAPGQSDFLASTFVVSKVVVHTNDSIGSKESLNVGWETTQESLGLTFWIGIAKPTGHKCARCWRYLEVDSNDLCGRCEDVVKDEHPQLLEQGAP